jgi:ferredoxin-like protein FixX
MGDLVGGGGRLEEGSWLEWIWGVRDFRACAANAWVFSVAGMIRACPARCFGRVRKLYVRYRKDCMYCTRPDILAPSNFKLQ